MRAVVTPEEMRVVDATAADRIDELIERAGAAVARAALAMLGGAYGRRVIVLAGSGNNGADGRVAAVHLGRRGVHVRIVDIDRHHPAPERIDRCDLVVDAVLGTGFAGMYVAPDVEGSRVLAVDVPSGLDALLGLVRPGSRVLHAERTITFVAWKPGLLFGDGPAYAGAVEVVDIGLPVFDISVHVLDEERVRARLPDRPRTAHKWASAVAVFGGSPGMTGAPRLAAHAAMRAGSGMVRIGVPGDLVSGTEAVGVALPQEHWAGTALANLDRVKAVVLGPGLGRSRAAMVAVSQLLAHASVPIVLDGDGLSVLVSDGGGDDRFVAVPVTDPGIDASFSAGRRAVIDAAARRSGLSRPIVGTSGASTPRGTLHTIEPSLEVARDALSGRRVGTTVLTPHDGEFERITGRAPGHDRVAACRRVAADTGAVVLLKGPTTVVADPTGRVELVIAGDERLATAGAGDVLSGIISALIAQGLSCFEAAACGAHIHGAAAALGPAHGFVAGDLADLIPSWWAIGPRR